MIEFNYRNRFVCYVDPVSAVLGGIAGMFGGGGLFGGKGGGGGTPTASPTPPPPVAAAAPPIQSPQIQGTPIKSGQHSFVGATSTPPPSGGGGKSLLGQ